MDSLTSEEEMPNFGLANRGVTDTGAGTHFHRGAIPGHRAHPWSFVKHREEGCKAISKNIKKILIFMGFFFFGINLHLLEEKQPLLDALWVALPQKHSRLSSSE